MAPDPARLPAPKGGRPLVGLPVSAPSSDSGNPGLPSPAGRRGGRGRTVHIHKTLSRDRRGAPRSSRRLSFPPLGRTGQTWPRPQLRLRRLMAAAAGTAAAPGPESRKQRPERAAPRPGPRRCGRPESQFRRSDSSLGPQRTPSPLRRGVAA